MPMMTSNDKDDSDCADGVGMNMMMMARIKNDDGDNGDASN